MASDSRAKICLAAPVTEAVHVALPVRRFPQVSVAHDIIAMEEAARFVAAQFIATRSRYRRDPRRCVERN